MEKLPLVLDLMGTFVFALSGALAGVKRALDLFGVLVLSFAAANSGGITRDLLIGVVPPGAVSDWHYLGFDQGLVVGNRVYTDAGPQSYKTNLIGMFVNVKL